MPFSIMFEVEGMPPRKGGGTSMWSKDKEINKLLALRTQIHNALQEHKITTPISDYLRLVIEIYLPEKGLERSDLDNLVGGIFDGLQSADNRAKLNGYKQYEGTPIYPFNSFIINDSRILELDVKKIINEKRNFYRVSMESLNISD